jgi:hypothetical protein
MTDELDDFKQLWQAGSEATPPVVDAEAIRQMIRQKASSALEKLERNLRLEMILGALLLAGSLWVCWFWTGEGAILQKLQMTFLALPFAVFYGAVFVQLKRKNYLRLDNLATSLEQTARFWRRALLLYFWGGMLLVPPIFITALTWRMDAIGADRVWLIHGDSTEMIVAKVIGLVVLSAVIVWILTYYSYGRHIRHLEKCVEEMKGES